MIDPRFDLKTLSAEGFEWTYEGAAPAQLSLALLADHLRDEGIGNVHVLHADGTRGWAEEAPFDAILVSAAAPVAVRLVIGGRETTYPLLPYTPAGSLWKRQEGEVILATPPVRVSELPGYEAGRTRGVRAVFRVGATEGAESSTTVGIDGARR